MRNAALDCRRSRRRLTHPLTVRFSVNGGPEYFSDTINFSTRSLAIRTTLPVSVGDRVRAAIEHSSPIEGSVVRVWGEGFAMTLPETSSNQAGSRRREVSPRIGDKAFDLSSALADGPLAGRLTPMRAPHSSWFSITCSGSASANQLRFLLITTAPLSRETVCSTWISTARARWLARPIDARRRDGQSIFVIRLSDWQLGNAAQHGLTFTAIMNSLDEWTADAAPDAVESQLASLSENAA